MTPQQPADDIGLTPRTQRHAPLGAQRRHPRHHLRTPHQQVMHGIIQFIQFGPQTCKSVLELG